MDRRINKTTELIKVSSWRGKERNKESKKKEKKKYEKTDGHIRLSRFPDPGGLQKKEKNRIEYLNFSNFSN